MKWSVLIKTNLKSGGQTYCHHLIEDVSHEKMTDILKSIMNEHQHICYIIEVT